MIHLYAIVDRSIDLPDVNGLEDAALEQRRLGALGAIVSRHSARRLITDEAALVRHAEVVDAVAERGAAVLPARFGSAYADEAALDAAIGANERSLQAMLTRVAGCVELGVRVVEPRAGNAKKAGLGPRGADYLYARLAEQRRRERLESEIHAPLERLARDSTRRTTGSAQLDFSAAYLVPHDAIEGFRRRFDEIVESHPELSLVCTGPWAPYSFAGVGDQP